MRIYKGIAIILFFSILFGSCFDAPEFSDTPQILSATTEFIEVPDRPGKPTADTIAVHITFKDGNGDLGLGEAQTENPFHSKIYYIEGSDGKLLEAIPENRYADQPPVLMVPGNGKLVTKRTKNKPGYNFLPAFNASQLGCVNYTLDKLLIDLKNGTSIDNSYNVIDTLYEAPTPPQQQPTPRFYVVSDTVYYTPNENHYNITVRFLVKEGNTFTEFNWEERYCTTFNGRFPYLTDRNNIPLEGTLTYSMQSTGFLQLFGTKPLKLKVQIKDRALNKSNEFETEPFNLK